MPLVLNSSPLIYLAKVGLLGLLGGLPEAKLIPDGVFDEVVVKGKLRGAPDALLVEKVIQEGIIQVRTLGDKRSVEDLLKVPGLHRADAQVLLMARELRGTAILDDEKARNVANASGIPNHGTSYLLMMFRRLGMLSKDEVRDKLDEMIRVGWRCSTDAYAEILRSAGI